MKSLLSFFTPKLPVYYVYMLQQVEYEPKKFSEWLVRILTARKSIASVMHRHTLVYTIKARALLYTSYLFVVFMTVLYVLLLQSVIAWWICLCVILLAMPVLLYLYLWSVTGLAYVLIVRPRQKQLVAEAHKIFQTHKGVKIAVLGSYGKTTMKELLTTVLSEGKKVASTPGNMNVSVSHAKFARTLSGDEEVLIVEFGEAAPGDIARMARMLQPDYAVITGLAPNHLDHYGSLNAVAADLLSIYDFVKAEQIFANGNSEKLNTYLPADTQRYTEKSVLSWKAKNVSIYPDKLQFSMHKGSQILKITSGLVGNYHVGPLMLVAALADKLGLSKTAIETGLAQTKPFAHRMQPRNVAGAWLIDDTYNGNIEGMLAGLAFLSELKAQRRWYVTPGLVDQGEEFEHVHTELGKAIAACNPDIVVLMDNVARPIIEASIHASGFGGELRIEADPLEFYLNIEHLVAAGDVVLMQNDWTDNYN